MADIYETASITIAATCSSDSDKGCFSHTQGDMMVSPIQDTGLFVRRRKPNFPLDINFRFDNLHENLWPLLSRAWVFQERKLSPSIVHLAREQLYWECKTCLISEDGREYFSQGDPGTYGVKMGSLDPKLAWREVVTQYSRLDLTYDSDRLPAISAVVKGLQSLREDDTYVAGMWTNSLLEDMTWFVPGGSHNSRPTEKYPT